MMCRIAQLESRVETLLKKTSADHAQPAVVEALTKMICRLDGLHDVLFQQHKSFADFMVAQSPSYQNDGDVPVSSKVHVVAQNEKLVKEFKDATTQTPLAQAPAVPLPPPPPVRTQHKEHQNKPSPLSQGCSSLENGPISFQNVSTTPKAVRSGGGEVESKTSHPAPSSSIPNTKDAGLRERRAAFAALQSAVPRQAAKRPGVSQTSLAIKAAQREMERAATRSRAEAKREQYVFL